MKSTGEVKHAKMSRKSDTGGMTTSSLELLTSFRQQIYQHFTQRRDTLYNLTDASLNGSPLLSPARLSPVSGFQSGWGQRLSRAGRWTNRRPVVETLLA